MNALLIALLARRSCAHRGASFKEDEGTWKGNDDGKVVNNQPQRVMDDRNGLGPQGGYIAKITNDAREQEMEENMGQVNTMIGNLRNMAIDMGSELENQNRQIDRINRKVSEDEAREYTRANALQCPPYCTANRSRTIWHDPKSSGDPCHRTSTRYEPRSGEPDILHARSHKKQQMRERMRSALHFPFRFEVMCSNGACIVFSDESFPDGYSFSQGMDLLMQMHIHLRIGDLT